MNKTSTTRGLQGDDCEPQQGSALACEKVSKRLGEVLALVDVSVSIAPGRVVGLLGPSGSGKTTLGDVLTGSVQPDVGTVRLAGTNVTDWPAHRRRIPVVPQEWDLFPHLTAAENVQFGLRVRGIAPTARNKAATAMLDRVGLRGRSTFLPHQLSGGQQQRVAFARALVVPSSFLILDEPFANVDQETRRDLRGIVRQVADEGRGVLLITHDHSDALSLADEIVCLIEGKVRMTGSPEEVYASPTSLQVAGLTGLASSISYELCDGQERAYLGKIRQGNAPAALQSCGAISRSGLVIVRPSWMRLAHEGEPFHLLGVVESVRYAGDHFLHYIRSADDGVWVEGLERTAPGTSIRLAVSRDMRLPVST